MTDEWKRWSDIPPDIIIEKRNTMTCKYCDDNTHIIFCFHCKKWHCICKHICTVCGNILQNKHWKYQTCECGDLVCYNDCKSQCSNCNKYKCNNCFKIIGIGKKLCLQCATNYCTCKNIEQIDCYQKCKICARYICVDCAKIYSEVFERYYCSSCIHAKLIARHNYLVN